MSNSVILILNKVLIDVKILLGDYMESVKILHTADIHIGASESFLGLSADKRRTETLLTFEKIVDIAFQNDVKIVALAGDIFDSNKVEQRFVTAFFEKIKSCAAIKFVFAAGNHDPLNAESPFLTYDIPSNLYVLGTKDECITFEDLGVRVYGRSFESTYLSGEESFSLETDDTYINIMVQHGDLKSDLSSDYNSITRKFIENSKMDYMALGHIHKRTEIGKIGNTYFAYCGCPEGQGFDELEAKGVYIGDISKNGCELEFLPVSKREHKLIKVDISECKASAEICENILKTLNDEIGENYRENLYKIELIGEIGIDVNIDTAEISNRLSNEVYFVKVKDKTEIGADFETLAKEISLKGIFVKKMLEMAENASETEKQSITEALKLGLKAFSSEVKYSED